MRPEIKLPSGVRWSGQLIATIVVCIIASVVVVVQGIPVLIAAVRPSADITKVDTTTPLLKYHTDSRESVQKRLEGRSMFVKPKPWKVKAPPAPPPPVRKPEDDKPPPPPPPPETYSGPKVIGIFGHSVYFDNGIVDEGKEGGGVTVVQIVDAWNLKLKHKTKVYDVSFGEKAKDELFKRPVPGSSVPGMTVSSPSAPGSTSASASTPATAPAPTGANVTVPTADPAAAPTGATPAPTTTPATGSTADVPAPLTKEAIQAMSREVAQTTLRTLAAAHAKEGLDEATKARLKQEIEWVGERLNPR